MAVGIGSDMSGATKVRGEAVGLYVHVPFCASKCNFCNFYVAARRHPETARLVEALIGQLRRTELEAPVGTVYIEGGSPSFLPDELLLRLVDAIHERLTGPVEITIEANPDQVDGERLWRWRERGINRLSLGAQSFDGEELAFLTRSYSPRRIGEAVVAARGAGFKNINLDLIFAIPGSSASSWRASLEAAVGLGVEHISAYSLTIEEGTGLYRQVARGEVRAVDEEMDWAMYDLAIEALTGAGYGHYEVSNFARAGFECAHNLGCWGNLDYVGIGPSAGSWRGGVRSTNIRGIRPFIEAVEAGRSVMGESYRPGGDERACETAVLMLRRATGIDRAAFLRQTGSEAGQLFAEAIATHVDSGLLAVDSERIGLTCEGLVVADAVVVDFAGV